MISAPATRECSCHCGGVRFTINLPEKLRATRCDCSICSMKGVVMVGVPLDDLTLAAGEELLSCYEFNTRAAKHFFCSRCGIHCFHRRRADPTQYGVNAACIHGMSPYYDFPELPVVDGVNHPSDGARPRLAGRLIFLPEPK
ncbi:hypothetical protein FHS61_002593 [Altererythrobacter atlanticus]|uniref:Glutathione-dependent formaldehyde-activating enzyme n=1 Tax=Croceibacterium atlanticum TaxID=1267766 RepID=A0A0F7KQP7_9SPHN|nr:GFA family protein [Croceibacterium atlanticum]AKH41879.1 Glutathione-dependent formaldehyde-activating enzyme [Croceibacterium atlanticum]MBB5733558.1 hypothetical protein [Croceibacterium atlanticum]